MQRNVKRAAHQRLDFSMSRSQQCLSEFYALHLETRRRLGVPVQPKLFFIDDLKRYQKQKAGSG